MEVFLLQWLGHARGRVRTVTFEGYESMIRLHAIPRIGITQLNELSPLEIQDFYTDLLLPRPHGAGLSAGSVRNVHLVLGQAFAQAVRWRMLDTSPVVGAQPPRPRRPPPVVVDPELLRRILDEVAGSWLAAPAAVAAATGMRRGEILALRWSDIDASFAALRVQRTQQPTRGGLVFEQPKTPRSRRTVLLPAFLRPVLELQRREQQQRRSSSASWRSSGLVIDRGDGAAVNPDSLSAGWARFLRRRNLPRVRFHDLRHAHATLMLSQGVHPKVVSERLGHPSIGITLDTYSHALPTLQQDAIEAFDRLFP